MGMLNRCETEVALHQKPGCNKNNVKNYQNFFSHDNDPKIINQEEFTENFECLFKDEIKKHESTKSALNKAI